MASGVDKVADAVKRGVDDARDTMNEAAHRTDAELERQRREANPDGLSPGEKVSSALKEGKDRVLAEVDKAKRDARHDG
jgi:hypothetical protein